MKLDNDMVERIIAIGMIAVGCLFHNWIITGIGIAYFISKM